MKTDRIKAYLIKFRKNFSEDVSRRALILLGIQLVLLFLLAFTVVIVLIIDKSDRRTFYLTLVLTVLALMFISLLINLSGKYKVSAWLTTIIMQLGPWGSILLDDTVKRGDLVPLIYLTISIQVCSILLSEKATLFIAIFQLASLAIFILTSPEVMIFNWASLIIFIVFTATLGIVTSFSIRKHIEQIEFQKSELQSDKIQLHALSIRDSLTGLFNRRYMQEILEKEIGEAIQKEKEVGIIMADIDHFKKINDTFGHAMGDYVLREVADILKSNIRNSDVACRFGGDEFILILPDSSLIQAQSRAEHLQEIIAGKAFLYEGMDAGRIALSYGAVGVPESGSQVDEVLKAVDTALYIAKKELLINHEIGGVR